MTMKKLLFLLTLSVSLCSLRRALCIALLSALSFAYAQTIPPPYINYQAVLYDVNGANPNSPLTNQSFSTFVNINDELGNLLYREEHYASTDANGLITVKMGDGLYTAGPITNFNQINWGIGKYYLVVDFDINGTISSTAPEQLVTVPYSFYAGNAGNGMSSVIDNGDGTLTFNYANGATYTTPTLSGIQGPAGPAGPSGPSGASGTAGPAGQSAYDLWLGQGNTGTVQDFLSTSAYQIWLAQGNTGTAQDFLNTLVGPQGPIGLTGATGPQGSQGIQGTVGLTGATGPQGIAGTNGANGTNGRSAYEIALLNGFVGTETQWLLSLVGATGSVGPNGAIGPQGIQGTNGTNGLNTVVKTSSEAVGSNCAAGGVKLEFGIDANNNGTLDLSEINVTLTKYVCNGINSSSQLNQGARLGFTSSVTWVCPVNVTQITVQLWGGGGGGGGGSATANPGGTGYVGCNQSGCFRGRYGGSGGKGGYNRAVLSVIPGNSYQIIIGIGGSGGNSIAAGCTSGNSGSNGANGNQTSFNNILFAPGGNGGIGAITNINDCSNAASGLDGSVNNYVVGEISIGSTINNSSTSYIPNNYLSNSIYPSCCANGGSGGNPSFGGSCGCNNSNTSGASGENGYCVISY
jgi:hypothetical protein